MKPTPELEWVDFRGFFSKQTSALFSSRIKDTGQGISLLLAPKSEGMAAVALLKSFSLLD